MSLDKVFIRHLYLSISLSIYISIYLSLYLSICLSIYCEDHYYHKVQIKVVYDVFLQQVTKGFSLDSSKYLMF